jgi:hypothetical protein
VLKNTTRSEVLIKLLLYRAKLNDLDYKNLMYFLSGYGYEQEATSNAEKTHQVYVDIFHMCYVSYSANVKGISEVFPCDSLESNVTSEVGIPGYSHILINRSYIE